MTSELMETSTANLYHRISGPSLNFFRINRVPGSFGTRPPPSTANWSARRSKESLWLVKTRVTVNKNLIARFVPKRTKSARGTRFNAENRSTIRNNNPRKWFKFTRIIVLNTIFLTGPECSERTHPCLRRPEGRLTPWRSKFLPDLWINDTLVDVTNL
jgi:hypothetical protein